MTDMIVISILTIVIASAVRYLVRAKKNGAACVGCPFGGNCGKCSGTGQDCHTDTKELFYR